MRNPVFLLTLLIVVMLSQLPTISMASQPAEPRPLSELLERLPRPQDRELLRAQKARLEPLFRDQKSDTRHSYDVQHYEINMDIDIPGDSVRSAAVFIDCRSQTDTLSAVDLDFCGMIIDSLAVDGVSRDYDRDGDLLLIHLGSAVSQGDSFQVAIQYHGRPSMGGDGGLTIDSDVTFTMCEPEGARYWFPCYDKPSDKATADMTITVPEDYVVASNGRLIATARDEKAQTATYSWSETYPIATYLISLAISRYATFSDWYFGAQDTMEIAYYIPPAESANAVVDFANLPDMIACYSELFGLYPFIAEKYGMATFPWGGAMEHQTCTSWGFPLPGNNYWDWVVAHELAHQWWGDWISPDNWKEIWLNEGFATYSEALWMEHIFGASGLVAYMREMQDYYVWWETHGGQSFPIYDPPPGYLFSSTEYEKAGCVLHMLRFVVGDSTFFDILKTYGATYSYGNAVTGDLQGVCEDVWGQDLDWFFGQWIYQPGFPYFTFAWNYELQRDKDYRVNISLVQQQTSGPIFEMPVEVGITTASKTILDTVIVDEESEQIQLTVEEQPLAVQLDPNRWLLCQREEIQVTEPILLMHGWTIDDIAGDGNGWLSPGETAGFIVALENQGVTASGISGILRTDDQDVVIADSTADFGEIRFYQSGDNALMPFVLSVPAGVLPHWADFTLFLTANSDYQTTIDFRLAIGDPTILLVDDDGGGYEDIFYTELLDSLGYIYDLYPVDKAGDGPGDLRSFDLVIWFTGRQAVNTLTPADQESLAAYLDGGGGLLIAGSGLGNDLDGTAFYGHYLHAIWDGETTTTLLQGVSGDPISQGSLMVLINQDGEQDRLSLHADAGTASCFNYLGDGSAAVRHESTYKTLYFGYSLEYTRSDNPSALSPYQLMGKILSWFEGPTPVNPEETPPALWPGDFQLAQNHPNPFNASTRISFQIPEQARVELKIFNIRGQEVRTLARERMPAGRHSLLWDGTDENGNGVASGIYFSQLRAGDVRKSVKMLLVR